MMINFFRLSALTMALVTLLFLPVLAVADTVGTPGEVIAQKITFRTAPKSNAKALGSIDNGSVLTILDEGTAGWYHVIYNKQEGYVMSRYVVENPEHITTLGPTQAYAYPGSNKRVGALASYTRLTVIGEYENYYVVNLREASGFISKKASLMFESEVVARPVLGRVQLDTDATARTGPAVKYNKTGDSLTAGQTYNYVGIEGNWYLILIDGGTRPVYIQQNTAHVI